MKTIAFTRPVSAVLKKGLFALVILALLLAAIGNSGPANAVAAVKIQATGEGSNNVGGIADTQDKLFDEPGPDPDPASQPSRTYGFFLPLLVTNQKAEYIKAPVMLGVYTQGWPGAKSTMDNEMDSLDAWAGKRTSIVGTYIDIQDPNHTANVKGQLETIWNNGYTPFVNISTTRSAYAVASGQLDSPLREWARAFAGYASNGQRMAYLAPLQEMNGDWVPYGLDPGNFKIAYECIQRIFSEEGVPSRSVRWTFSPNGWSAPGDPTLEDYYPGDGRVDVVSFSAYNFGYSLSRSIWQEPDEVFGEYLDRLRAMAPTKPIFIAQTATSAYKSRNNYSVSEKNRWLREAYDYLAGYPGVRAVLYFNLENWQNVDWPFYVRDNASRQFKGYQDAVADPRFEYISPEELIDDSLLVQ